MLTKIDLCSMALLKLGEKPIQSFNDDTAAAQLSRTLSDTVTDSLLCMHPWRFASRKFELAKTTENDFLIPGEVLRVLACSVPVYEIVGNKIIAAADKISVTAISRIGPENYPAFFASLAATKLAIEFCIPLTDNQNTLQILAALFESELRAAKFIDSASATAPIIPDFSLISTRF
ncbi:MAG: hypothetical protein FWC61_01680 [Proteobacteria bacterium]|nr:hypothetical protein [Pseudomonadota bacterium]